MGEARDVQGRRRERDSHSMQTKGSAQEVGRENVGENEEAAAKCIKKGRANVEGKAAERKAQPVEASVICNTRHRKMQRQCAVAGRCFMLHNSQPAGKKVPAA